MKYMVPSTPLKSSLFNSPQDVFDWLSRFINFEQVRNKRGFSLDRIKHLAELADQPEKCAPSIHVAGSKGKGSVTAMIAAILEASGIKIARYASPHVYDFRERLMMGSEFFPEEIYIRAGNELRDLVNALPLNPEDYTFFELITLWFFLCGRLARCRAMVVETGMGGRLDATNILDPLVSVITGIELEHTEYLGETLAAISSEKAGIIKQTKPLILAEQCEEALRVFKEHTENKKSPLIYFPDCAEFEDIKIDQRGTCFTLILKKTDLLNGIYRDLFVPIPGEVYAKNTGLAILAAKTAFPDIDEDCIRKGLSNFTLPARFERISETPLLVLDGAHTSLSIGTCVKTFSSLYGEGGILIFGCAAGKDARSMAKLSISYFSMIIITTPGTFKKSAPEEIYSAFTDEAKKIDKPPEIILEPETAKAVKLGRSTAIKKKLPILGAGSFYLAGEIKKIFVQIRNV